MLLGSLAETLCCALHLIKNSTTRTHLDKIRKLTYILGDTAQPN